MDQFNKVLAGLLVLFVALGLATLVFVRLGLFNRILKPTPKDQVVVAQSQTPTPSPVTEPTQTKSQQEENGSLLGFLFPKQKTPTPAPQNNKKTDDTRMADKTVSQEKKGGTGTQQEIQESPFVTIVPYGATQPTAYPASGPPQSLLFLASALLPLGFYLRARNK